jgi:DNA-directed RNA polymerase omega subunit
MEELLPKADNSSYKLVVMASKRALELANGAPKLIEAHVNEKLATTSLREIIAGKVVFKDVAEQFAPKKGK